MAFLGKRIVISIILAVILIGGSFALSNNNEKLQSATPNASLKQASLNIAEVDTDGDGLKDWEERLWKSDYKNPDTDGDGTKDGEEISLGRDPIIAGPDDLLSRYRNELISVSDFATDKSLNTTDVLGRAFLSEYIGAKASGSALTSSEQQNIINEIVSGKLSSLSPKVYIYQDLNISADNSKAALEIYAEGVASLLLDYAKKTQSELAVLGKALGSNDPADLKKLDPIVLNMQTVISGLLNLKVPQALAEKHLNFINAFSAVKEDVSLMRQVFSDPVVGLLAVTSYKKDSADFASSFVEIKNYVKSAGVRFQSNEPAYSLFK